MSRSSSVAPLWHRRDAAGPFLAGLVGVVLCVVAWWQASGDRTFRQQLSLATVSVIGLVLIVGAEAAWVLRGRAIVGRRIRALLGSVPPAIAGETPVLTGERILVAGPDLRLYHRPECALAEGHGWAAAGSHEHRQAGRRPCGVCRPLGRAEEAI